MEVIAGRFQLQHEAEDAMQALMDAGFAADRVTRFFLNPRGMHDAYPIGGDVDRSRGAEDSPSGLAVGGTAGAAVGAVVGAATLPVTGPIGPLAGAAVGAHVGNTMASMGAMKDDGGEIEQDVPRHAGMMVAVAVQDAQQSQHAVEILRGLGAQDLEQAQGTIADGDWVDFDPLSTAHLVIGGAASTGQGRSGQEVR